MGFQLTWLGVTAIKDSIMYIQIGRPFAERPQSSTVAKQTGSIDRAQRRTSAGRKALLLLDLLDNILADGLRQVVYQTVHQRDCLMRGVALYYNHANPSVVRGFAVR